MQRSIFASVGVCATFLFLATPAAATELSLPVFSSKMICDTDGVSPFTDKAGTAIIFNNGDLALHIRGLRPSTAYTCLIACNVGAKVVTAPCSTNTKGTLATLLPGLGRSDSLASGCGQPVVTAFVDDPNDGGDFCMTGYGEP